MPAHANGKSDQERKKNNSRVKNKWIEQISATKAKEQPKEKQHEKRLIATFILHKSPLLGKMSEGEFVV